MDHRTNAEQHLNLAVRNIHDAAANLASERVNPQTANELSQALKLIDNARRRERLGKALELSL